MENDLFGNHTDYTHFAFDNLAEYLENKADVIEYLMTFILEDKKYIVDSGYWYEKIHPNFALKVEHCIELYKGVEIELRNIKSEIQLEVQQNHYERLLRIGKDANKINWRLGEIWHQEYLRKEYGNKDFDKVERIYRFTRDLAVTLTDLANFAERLKDFIGKKNKIMKNNPWISGSFYLFLAVVAFTLLGVLVNFVHWSLIPFIIIGGLLIVGLVGILQLRNDDKLKDESFGRLFQETYKRLPLLRQILKKEDKVN